MSTYPDLKNEPELLKTKIQADELKNIKNIKQKNTTMKIH